MSEEIISQRLLVPVIKRVDVLVVGGGPSGIIAALCAAQNGAKTMLIERCNFTGGCLTAGLVQVIGPFNDRAGNLIIEGKPLEFIQRITEMGGTRGDPREIVWLPQDSEITKYVADQMLVEANVELLYDSLVVDAVIEADCLRGVVFENKAGRQAVIAGVTIDCTGDADVAARAGVPYELGWPGTCLMQPMTLGYRINGVCLPTWPDVDSDTVEAYQEAIKRHGPISGPDAIVERSITSDSEYARPGGLPLLPLIREGECFVNKTRIPGSGIDPGDITKAAIEGRRQAWEQVTWLNKHLSQFREAYISQTAPMVGVRETRRIIGEYQLTKEDVLSARKFFDGVARGHYWIDIHDPQSSRTYYTYLKPGTWYDIPYRCLLPKGITGLLVAGRCISGTYEAAASYRIMSHCMAVGQAAGTAAALAMRHGIPPDSVNIEELRDTLVEQRALV